MKKYLASATAALLLIVAGTARGQGPQPPQQQQPTEEAGPGVARISFIHGDVSTQHSDNGEWATATVNTPVEAGDRVSTGDKSRAEVQLDFANILRLSDSATANIASLNRTQIQVQVGQGLVTYSVLKGSEANAEIDTPNVAVRPQGGEGEYRILVNGDGETLVIVRKGSAEIATPQGSTQVNTGQMITIAGTDNPQYQIADAPGKDDWDGWNIDRNKLIANAGSWQHTNRYYTGSENLDPYGTWSEVPDYGQVWTPTVAPDWAPYRDGSWVYEPYYGWTWVSYEPWGWAPYHYGRWFVYGGNWVWWPGPVARYPGYYPVWSPAYVSFFGFGGGGWGFGFGFGFGTIGWLPIGPCDWYRPWYGRWGSGFGVVAFDRAGFSHEGFGPLGRANWHQYSNFHDALGNARVREGMSSMSSHEFGQGRVSVRQQAISESSLRGASMMTGRMPVSATRASFSAAGHAANPSTFRNAPSTSQRFFTASRAGSGNLSFNANRAGSTQSAVGANGSNRSFARPSNNAAAANRQGFSSPSQSSGATARSNWHTFTPPTHSVAQAQASRSYTPPSNSQRSYQPPISSAPRGSSYSNRSYSNSYSRPPLNMRQPVVTPRSNPASAPRGNYSAPRGNYSAPRTPSGGGSGGGSRSSGGSSHGSSHPR